jgi:hypothetical protein
MQDLERPLGELQEQVAFRRIQAPQRSLTVGTIHRTNPDE